MSRPPVIRTPPRSPTRRREGGAVLLVVMMVMMGILGLGVTALWMTSGNLQVAANMNLRTQALYAAEAGLEHARSVFNRSPMPAVVPLLTGSNPATDNVPTAVDPTTGLPNGVGALLVDQAGVTLRDVAFPPASFGRSAGTATAPTSTLMGTYTVWVRNDTAELRQGMFTADSNGAVVVRSQGVASDGRTNVVLEVTLSPIVLFSRTPGTPGGIPPVLCASGKNACDDNNSTAVGIVTD